MTWTNAWYPRNCIFTNIWTMIIHGPRCELQRWFEQHQRAVQRPHWSLIGILIVYRCTYHDVSNPWETTQSGTIFDSAILCDCCFNSFKLLAKNTHKQTKNKTTLFHSIHDEHTQIIPLTVNWLYKFTQSLVGELPYSTIMPEERSKSELSPSKNVKYTIDTYPANPKISKDPSLNGSGWNTYFV